MIGDVFNEAYLLRGVDGHVHVGAASQTIEAHGDLFENAARLGQFNVYLPLLAATLRPSIDSVRVILLRFAQRTFSVVFTRDGFIAISARPETPLRKLRSASMKIARSVEQGPPPAPAARQTIAHAPAPAHPAPPQHKQRTKLGIWD